MNKSKDFVTVYPECLTYSPSSLFSFWTITLLFLIQPLFEFCISLYSLSWLSWTCLHDLSVFLSVATFHARGKQFTSQFAVQLISQTTGFTGFRGLHSSVQSCSEVWLIYFRIRISFIAITHNVCANINGSLSQVCIHAATSIFSNFLTCHGTTTDLITVKIIIHLEVNFSV